MAKNQWESFQIICWTPTTSSPDSHKKKQATEALFSSSPVCTLSQRIIVYLFEPGKKTNDNFGLYLSHFIKYKGTACPVRQVLESPWLILIP